MRTKVILPGRVPMLVPHQIAQRLKHEIQEGRFEEEAPFPSHRTLCKLTGASLNTVRLALDILEKEGLIYRRQRSGTFVRRRPDGQPRPVDRSGLTCINIIEPEQPDTRAAIRADYLAGYADALGTAPIETRFVAWAEAARNPDAAYSTRHAHGKQGFILLNIVPPDFLIWLLGRRAAFVVQHFCYYPTRGLPKHNRIFVNKVGGAFEGTRHLLDLGHRRIAFAGRIPKPNAPPSVYEGYRTALLCAGLGTEDDDVFDFGTDDVELAMPHVRQWFASNACPDAVFAQTDAMAIAVLRVAAERGVRVPQDLSVVGFNDLPECAATTPPLTTVADPRRRLGREAVEMLLALAASRRAAFETRILNCHLVLRGTTGPAAGHATPD